MHVAKITESIEIPSGVTVRMEGPVIHVKGPKGELSRTVATKDVVVTTDGGHVTLTALNATRNEKRMLQTSRAHVANMVKGATQGHVYKLKICSGHFPMSVAIKGKTLEVKNFIGEAVPRTMTLQDGATVKIDGQIITVESANKERAGNQAAAIELLTRRPGFDNRVFQDGIYIIEKDGKKA